MSASRVRIPPSPLHTTKTCLEAGLRLTERAGFEPATHLSARTRFPVALLRPLGHLSADGSGLSRTKFEPGRVVGTRQLAEIGRLSPLQWAEPDIAQTKLSQSYASAPTAKATAESMPLPAERPGVV